MTFTDEFRSWSRRQRTNAFKAALEAEYAGRVEAGMIAKFEPVLTMLKDSLGFENQIWTY